MREWCGRNGETGLNDFLDAQWAAPKDRMIGSPFREGVRQMSDEKKRKRNSHELLGGSFFREMNEIFERSRRTELSGGYSVSVTQTPEGTEVYAKVGNGMDVNDLSRQLQQQYPGAKIEIEGGRPLIREISTKPVEETQDEKNERYV